MEAVMIYIFFIIWIALSLHISCGKTKKVQKTSQSSAKRESEKSKKREKSHKKQKPIPVEKSEGEKEEGSESQQKQKEAKKEVPKEQPKEVKMEEKPIVVSPPPEKEPKEEAPKAEEKSEKKKDKGDNTVREIAPKDLAKEVVEKHKPTIVTISKENADPEDGNYEDVNLMEAVAPDGTQLQLITVDPLHASFPASGGRSFHTLLNIGEKRIIFKMKSSNNNDYRITPVYGFVDPIGSTVIQVLRLPGPVRDDKMVVNYTAAPEGATDPTAAFKELPSTAVIQTIPVIFNVTSDGNPPPGAALVPGVHPAALVPAAPTPAT